MGVFGLVVGEGVGEGVEGEGDEGGVPVEGPAPVGGDGAGPAPVGGEPAALFTDKSAFISGRLEST